jgi:hypothetical protein
VRLLRLDVALTQLRIWPGRYPWTPVVDLAKKLREEMKRGVEVRYHFERVPLEMRPPDRFDRLPRVGQVRGQRWP